MRRLALRLSQKLVEQGIIQESDIDVYRYGLEILISSCTTSLSIIVVATILNSPGWGILYLIICVPLKVNAGGYHATTYVKCFFISNLSYVVLSCTYHIVQRYNIPLFLWFLILLGSSIYIYNKAPVQHPNQPLSHAAINKNKRKTMVYLTFDCLFVVLLLLFAPTLEIISFFALTISLVALFIIPTQQKGGV